MSEPPRDPDPAPRSFAVPDFGSEPSRPIGCSKPALVGCGLVLLLVMVASALIVFNSGRLFRWGLAQTQSTILAALPAEVTDEEVARLEAAFEAVATAVTGNRVDPRGIQNLRRALQEALEKAQASTLTRQEVLDLTTSMEQVAGDGHGG